MKVELDQKKDVLASMEAELAKASHWNSQVVGSFHRCDMMLSKYTEQVSQLGDRWRRINGQIDTRYVFTLSNLFCSVDYWFYPCLPKKVQANCIVCYFMVS